MKNDGNHRSVFCLDLYMCVNVSQMVSVNSNVTLWIPFRNTQNTHTHNHNAYILKMRETFIGNKLIYNLIIVRRIGMETGIVDSGVHRFTLISSFPMIVLIYPHLCCLISAFHIIYLRLKGFHAF